MIASGFEYITDMGEVSLFRKESVKYFHSSKDSSFSLELFSEISSLTLPRLQLIV